MVWVGCGLPDHIDEAAQQEEGSAARWPRSKKKGRWRGGGTARRRVSDKEVELPVSSSKVLNLESKEEQWKCGFWWEGGGREIDISAVAKKSLGAARNWRASVVQEGAMDCRR